MEDRDARTLSAEAQEELRRQAIRLLKAGNNMTAVARQLDVSREAVGNWWRTYQTEGWSGLKKKKIYEEYFSSSGEELWGGLTRYTLAMSWMQGIVKML